MRAANVASSNPTQNKDFILPSKQNKQHRGSILASHPAAPGSNPIISDTFSEEKLLILLRLINGTG